MCLATNIEPTPTRNERLSTTNKEKVSTGTMILKRIPHYVFHGYSKEKVKKVIDEHTKSSNIKLRMDGNKETLEKRFREFVHLNNAQVDGINPLSFEEVIRQVNNRETAKEIEAKKSINTLDKLEKLKNGEVSYQFCYYIKLFNNENSLLKILKMAFLLLLR